MPELPEVETVRRGLEQAMVGRTITNVILRRENLRFPFPENLVATLIDRRVDSIRRRAKYLLIDLDDGHVILSHLGMSGRYTLFDAKKVHQYTTSMILMNGLDLVLQQDLMDDTTMLSFNLMMEALLCIPIHVDSEFWI